MSDQPGSRTGKRPYWVEHGKGRRYIALYSPATAERLGLEPVDTAQDSAAGPAETKRDRTPRNKRGTVKDKARKGKRE